jgi:chromosome segregation ATPase
MSQANTIEEVRKSLNDDITALKLLHTQRASEVQVQMDEVKKVLNDVEALSTSPRMRANSFDTSLRKIDSALHALDARINPLRVRNGATARTEGRRYG